jgi:hypothetical protein
MQHEPPRQGSGQPPRFASPPGISDSPDHFTRGDPFASVETVHQVGYAPPSGAPPAAAAPYSSPPTQYTHSQPQQGAWDLTSGSAATPAARLASPFDNPNSTHATRHQLDATDDSFYSHTAEPTDASYHTAMTGHSRPGTQLTDSPPNHYHQSPLR